jgi:ATP-binding cassette subfamily F protein 3
MGQIAVKDITKYFGTRPVLDGISFVLGNFDRLAIVGPNGTGKTTLMKIIVGELEPDAGLVTCEGGKTVGYFAQDRAVDISEDTLFTFVRKGFKNVTDIADRLDEITSEIEKNPTDDKLIGKLARYQHEYEALGGFEIDLGIEKILSGLGFTKNNWTRPVSSLSGGERTRLQLARVLAQKPDTLILDEPTNHLDLNAVIWLEGFLNDFPGSVLIVSHDRYLLDKVCTHTVMIFDGKSFDYAGNFTWAKNQFELEKNQAQVKIEEQQKFIDRANRFIKRFKGYGTEIAAKKARNMERRLERVTNNLIEAMPEDKSIALNLESSGRTGEIVFKTRNLAKSFDGKKLFENVNVELKRGQKVAIIGPNGCGKTTFLKVVIDAHEPTSGSVWMGYNVEPVYLEQELGNFDPDATVMQEIMNNSDLLLQEARDHLATFLFQGDDVFKDCRKLSGGEISRLILAKLALISANFMVFDEPTNHLDINARAALEETIKNYNGTVLIVSHDRYFVKNIGARIWLFENNMITDTREQLEEFLEKYGKKEQPKEEAKPQAKKTVQTDKPKAPSKNQLKSKRDEVSNLENKIAELEARKTELEAMMENPDFYSKAELAKQNLDEYVKLKEILKETEDSWAKSSSELEILESL